jgi:uncharacterized protein
MLGSAGALLLASCAGPALTTYTLALPPPASDIVLPPNAPVIVVSRITVPSDEDSTDITLRDGSVLRRSISGRWGSRLAVGMTTRVAERLAERFPKALVTTAPQTDAAAATVRINISRLDIGADGNAVLEADWSVVPGNAQIPARQQRTRIALQGPVATDQDVVTLTGQLADRLAAAIDLGTLR